MATPHVSWRYANDAATIAALVEQTNAALAEAEHRRDGAAGRGDRDDARAPTCRAEELAALTLGGGPWLLLECPFTSVADRLDELIVELEEAGHGVVLAHPERCPAFQRDPQLLESLVRDGVLTSITAGSLVGRFGAHGQALRAGAARGRAGPQRGLRRARRRAAPARASPTSCARRAWRR